MLRFVWLTLLALHIGLAVVWWAMMPHGFPSSSSQFWLNETIPLLLAIVLVTALFARGRVSEAILPPILAAIPVFWMATAISARVVFVDSCASAWHLPFIGGAILAGLWVKQFRGGLRPLVVVPVALVAALAGWSFPDTQRAPDPSTNPTGAPLGELPTAAPDHKMIKLTKDAQVHATDGRIVIRRDPMVLNVMPMLTFADRSPDRCWTEMAPPEDNTATKRSLVSKLHDGARWTLVYKDEDASIVDLSAQNGAVHIESRSRLKQPIFSHANSFAELTVMGHKKLSVAFSPVPQQRIEPAPPAGAVRFAWIDAAGTFHLAQAKQQQRGPFTELASGPLSKSQPLTMTIYDGDKPMFTVSLDDFAAQASTQLSPAAGDGVTVNAIELQRGGEAENTPVLITLTLAATTMGRGTESVGHAAGVYRDRITVTMP